MRLDDYDRARKCIQIAVSLPHSDPASIEHYSILAREFYRELELYRRDREAERVEELRRQSRRWPREWIPDRSLLPRRLPPPAASRIRFRRERCAM